MTKRSPDPGEPLRPGSGASPPLAGSSAPTTVSTDRPTRISAAWVATGVGLLVLAMLFVFILQNQHRAEIDFLGWSGSMPVGLALLGGSIAGGAVVGIVGAARLVQLRRARRRNAEAAS